MSDLEENKRDEESSNSKETNKDAATPEVLEVEKTLEVTETSEYNERNKGITIAVKTSTAIAATAVVAIVSYSVISSSGLINLTMDAKINSVEFVDDGLDYDINVIDVKISNKIYFSILYNDEQVMKYDVDIKNNDTYSGALTGHFSFSDIDLEKELDDADGNLEYTVRLCGNTGLVDRTYDSWIVEIDSLESEFKSVTYEYQYDTTGYFVFQMDYVDNYSQFSDFMATLSDSSGHVSYCKFTNNYHDEQKISVIGIDSLAKFTISINFNESVDALGNKLYSEVYTADITL